MRISLIWVAVIRAPIRQFIGKITSSSVCKQDIVHSPFACRPLGSSQNRSSFRSPLAAKYPRNHLPLTGTKSLKGTETGAISKNGDLKCTSAVQTDISALPHQWRSETQLIGSDYCLSGFTLPSKYSTPQGNSRSGKSSLR